MSEQRTYEARVPVAVEGGLLDLVDEAGRVEVEETAGAGGFSVSVTPVDAGGHAWVEKVREETDGEDPGTLLDRLARDVSKE